MAEIEALTRTHYALRGILDVRHIQQLGEHINQSMERHVESGNTREYIVDARDVDSIGFKPRRLFAMLQKILVVDEHSTVKCTLGVQHEEIVEIQNSPSRMSIEFVEPTPHMVVHVGEWTPEKNARRCLLIDKEIDSNLTELETRELETLQAQMLEHRRNVAPRPIDEIRRMHAKLMFERE